MIEKLWALFRVLVSQASTIEQAAELLQQVWSEIIKVFTLDESGKLGVASAFSLDACPECVRDIVLLCVDATKPSTQGLAGNGAIIELIKFIIANPEFIKFIVDLFKKSPAAAMAEIFRVLRLINK